MQNKKILFLALLGDPTLPAGMPYTGGFNQTLSELITSLAAYPIPICIITDESQYSLDDYTRISNNIDLYRIHITESEHKNQEALRAAINRIISDIINILGSAISDIVLIHSFYWLSGHIAKCLNNMYRIPYIHTPISLAYHKTAAGCEANCPFQAESEPAFLKHANYVLAITEQEAQILTSYYQVQPTKVIVTGRSVDKVFHSPARDNKGCPRGVIRSNVLQYAELNASWWNMGAYTYLGRMVAIKGILQIIQAWVALRKRYGSIVPPLWLVGGTPVQIANLREEIINHVDDISAYENEHGIVWWGYLDQASISALFLKTLVLVTHSKFEPGGRVVLEAMCQGKPVIATPNGFAADYIQDGVNGFLVPYGNIVRLEQCMEYFIRQPYLSCSMGNAAKLTFEQIERNWNYTGIHRGLYERYLEGGTIQLSNPGSVLLPFTREVLEKVDCFPYIDICFSSEEWIEELSPHFFQHIEEFNPIILEDANARHYKWKWNGNWYRAKQFYSRINENAIWNRGEKNKVIGSADRLLLANKSQEFSGVVSYLFSSEQGRYYVLPELDRFFPDYKELCNLLDAFSTSITQIHSTSSDCDCNPMSILENLNHTSSYFKTLESGFDLLAASSRELKTGISKNLLSCIPQLSDLLDQSRDSIRFGINYGKPVSHHVIVQNERPLLLPTADWYWGELGADYVFAALQAGKTVHAILGQTDATRQQLWQVYLAWKEILKTEWRNISPNPLWTRWLVQAMSQLGLSDFVKF